MGCAQWHDDPDQGEATLVRAVEVAHQSGREATVSLTMGSLGVAAGEYRRYRSADHWLSRVVDWCVANDLDAARDYYRACLARCHFEQGRWSPARATTEPLTTAGYPLTRVLALAVVGRLRARCGDPDATTPLTEAWELATQTGSLQRLWRSAAGRAEAAWLTGHPERIPALVDDVFQEAVRAGHPWAIGELGFWLWRAGALAGPPPGAAEPYARQISGDWAGAARASDLIGCPYEAADTRSDSDRPDGLLAALEVLHRLGARPMADRVAARLRGLGVRRLPRRPHISTLDNPGHLTARELEVVSLLVADLSNADIAARLHISARTAAHHVSAIMAKLDAPTRHAAARIARTWGAPSQPGPADGGPRRPEQGRSRSPW